MGHESGIPEIAGFLRGDPDAVAEVRGAVRAIVRSFQFRGRDIERDLVQETISRLVRNLGHGRFRGEAALRTYAQQVAKYVCLEHIRRQRAEVCVDFDTFPSGARWSEPEAALLLHEEHALNLQAFAGLPAESRRLLRLLFVEGLTYGELARRWGLSESAIKSRVHRARNEYRERMAGLERARKPSPGRVER
jgi:RNA polymerase sigma-70 factor (ECF subfamily)